MSYLVYPVPGYFVPGIPAQPTECATKKEADALVATGAFTHAPAEPAPEPAPEPEDED